MGISGTVERYRAAGVALAALPGAVDDYRALTENEILTLNDECTAMERALAVRRALIAGELAHRSRDSLGSEGLARRSGHRTVEALLKHTAGLSGQQAVTAVRAGRLLGEVADDGRVDEVTGEVLAPSQPWLVPVATALVEGSVSPTVAEAIGLGLGKPTSSVRSGALALAAAQLVAEAIAGLDPDGIRRRARELRDELDLTGVALREEERRAERSLIHFPKRTGGGKVIWNMDPETYASFIDFFDRAVTPKTRGVRFVSEQQSAIADRIAGDERTMEQLASDTLLQLLAQGMDADTSYMLGTGAPVIRVTVSEQALETGVGLARIDGQPDAVSLDTAKRLLCTGEAIRMKFGAGGTVLDLEREQRLFSKRQREVLAVKFGGCMAPGCNRPPSWCEAHHILQWKRDGGKTEIENGILLCKHHHLKYHNEHYEIIRDEEGSYWMIPPVERDPMQLPVHMPLKSRALSDLWRRAS